MRNKSLTMGKPGTTSLPYICSCSFNHLNFVWLQAFTRCAQQEPDNGEAWNNIAAIHLQLQHAPEAFSALSEAVKYKRDSWQTWANYGQAAAQTGNNLPAARAVQKASFLPIDMNFAFRLEFVLFDLNFCLSTCLTAVLGARVRGTAGKTWANRREAVA